MNFQLNFAKEIFGKFHLAINRVDNVCNRLHNLNEQKTVLLNYHVKKVYKPELIDSSCIKTFSKCYILKPCSRHSNDLKQYRKFSKDNEKIQPFTRVGDNSENLAIDIIASKNIKT